jgi:sugar transferase (PEP-CTERM/EpsH1 system associated)
MTGARAAMEPLLFLCHRLPYPPNKGDKVRSYHFLEHLAGRYRVFLGTFVDDPADWQHVERLKALCADVHVELLSPRARRVGSATGFLTGEALTLPYFRSRRLRAWVQATTRREGIKRAFAFSSPMAQYLVDVPQVRRFIDFVDLDSAKWGDYARTRRWPISALYAREARRLLCFERDVARGAEAVIFVTEDEARLFHKAAPESAVRIMSIRNGVDSDYFSPAHDFESPFAAGERPVVFTGAMDYWPNVDAVLWFAREVLPEIRRRDPAARFYVVGMNPDAAIRALGNDPATVVTGRVSDVRPYLKHARVVVAPLRVARGIQNKVLEAMAMAKPTVLTPATAAALSALQGAEIEVAAEPREFAAKVLESMDPVRGEGMGMLARSRVLADYAWPASFKVLDELLERDRAPSVAAVLSPANDVRHALPAKVIAR